MADLLGRVDKRDPLFHRGQLGEAEKAAGSVVVASGHSPAVLDLVEEPLDAVAGGIQRPVDGVLNPPVSLGRDFRPTSSGANLVADGVAVVAAVGKHDLGIGAVLAHQVVEGGAVVRLARRQQECDWKTLGVGQDMDLGRKPAA